MELLNRDVSWLSFNSRVADESTKPGLPLMERIMFHSITFSNLGEFMEVRYPSIMRDGDTSVDIVGELEDHYDFLCANFAEFNAKNRVIRRLFDVNKHVREWARSYFRQNIFPAIIPLTLDFRQATIRSGLYILTVSKPKGGDTQTSIIEIPSGLDRFIRVPGKGYTIPIEDIISECMPTILSGHNIVSTCPFMVRRSSEVFYQDDSLVDPFQMIKRTLQERSRSWVTAIEIGSQSKDDLKRVRKLVTDQDTVIFTNSIIRLEDISKLPKDLRGEGEMMREFKSYDPFPSGSLFDHIKKGDRLCFHPYESYEKTFVRFIEEAAIDPDVVSVRISLYRVSDQSRIIGALLRAADNGKMVTVLVELKARFDEKHNMEISTILREGGIQIVYTKPDIKTHAKVCLVTRKEKKGLRVYGHIGTGNYSEINATRYTDYSYFTANRDVGNELTQFFNLLTSEQAAFKSRTLVYAPYNMRDTIGDHIKAQIKRAKDGKSASIIAKCNAISDDKMAKLLIEAAKAGVKVTLIVRSGCIVPNQKNIEVHSILGRFLEHSRVYVFGSGKNSTVMIGSSDLMHRNLNRRNELLIKVEEEELKERLLMHLKMYLKDNVGRRVMTKGHKYCNVKRKDGEKRYDVQKEFSDEAQKLAN